MALNPTERFSNRVDDYVKYRPGYPAIIINYLREHFDLNTDKIIADIGAGTGISTSLFLKAGYPVRAVEPNKEMREKLMELSGQYPKLVVTDGTAENTNLPDKSIDAIVAAQAFHWFNAEISKAEFKRILKTGGLLVLIWNERKTDSDFEMEYEKLILKFARDYRKVDHRNINPDDIERFFYPLHCESMVFDNYQSFDLTGLKGRLSSSSYMPAKGDTGFEEMMRDLEKLFEKYKEGNRIRINYDTKLYAGRFA
jgi:SAM-dependent methyltransferase